MDAAGQVWLTGNVREIPAGATPEGAVKSMVEFADFVEANPNKKGTSRFQLRIDLDDGAEVTVEAQFDSDGVWQTIDTLTTTVKRSFALPFLPRRSDHFRIRLLGKGQWHLYSLVRENYIGSDR